MTKKCYGITEGQTEERTEGRTESRTDVIQYTPTCSKPGYNQDNTFHRFLIWPLIAGLLPFEVLIRKTFLLLFLLDRSKDFLEIKCVNSYLYGDVH